MFTLITTQIAAPCTNRSHRQFSISVFTVPGQPYK
uniref:Uncharacterized protein n=1 Tax=Arundo donax TaxID=35708 RepID=A0A0A9F5A0_ARUDO